MGDGFLVEFGSVLNAARCAVEIQRGMLERNAGAPEDRHIKFRIGINLGDVIVDGEDVYGDGVNLAARLEGLAGPGGIACSATVRDQVGDKLELEFIDHGEQTVKNIVRPMRVYFVNWTQTSAEPAPQSAGGVAASASDKPSVAVLPFTNMSNDPEQEFFSDGITEDIITDLSKVSGLFVLGRNTVFTYKGKAVNLERIAKELGRCLCGRGERSEGRPEGADQRPADRRGNRRAHLGRALRRGPERYLRAPGRDHAEDRGRAEGQAPARGRHGHQGGADEEC